MVAYTTALLAAANLLALAHAAPAQPVCFAVTTVITGSPIWVPRADPTTGAGWGAWPNKDGSSSVSTTTKASVSTTTKTGPTWSASSTTKTTWTTTSSGGAFYPVTSSTIPLTTITVTPTPDVLTSTPTPSTSAPAPPPAAPTCSASGTDVFSTSPSGSCDCDFTVSCNRHAPYGASTKFWERTTGEIIGSLQECQNICNDNSECEAAIWVNRDGAPDSEYLRCWQTSGLPEPDSDGYGQLSYKGSCSGSCSQSYSGH